jgi:hypothetical protein
MAKTAPDPNAPEPTAQAVGGWPVWEYTGPAGRIYTNVPVTPEPGDRVTWPVPPAEDGCWAPTTEPENRKPDNWRDI